MAPNRVRATEDSRSESSLAATKQGNGAANAGISKGKKAASAGANGGSHLKDVQSVRDSASQPDPLPGDSQIVRNMLTLPVTQTNWSTVSTRDLHAYRHAHKVDTPSAFSSFENMLSLTNPQGLGKFSPTMARRQDKRRVTKEQLALAVRKDFNATAVNETEVLTSFLYAAKNRNKPFRMRFGPGKSK